MTSGPPDAASMPREAGSARITYSTEFLLSVGGSDHCKKLPVGIDATVLSELLGRSDAAGAYSRTGRWDARSSGSSDHEGDLPGRESNQLDKCSGNQSRHNWRNTEHDGLLGSGAFPRPLGYVRPLASNDRGSGYQLSRNSGRYQPPRPYKDVPVSRKDIDSINDETFGSFECSSDDIVEEERKRRAAFELMRKEQHKAMQEKKIAPDSEKENIGDDTISLLQNSAEKRGPPTKSNKQDELKVSSLSKEDAIKTSALLPTPTTRPLKPPGFANALPEKRLQLQSSNTSLNSENKSLCAHNATREEKISEVMCLGGPKEGNKSAKSISTSKNEQNSIPDSIGTIGQKHEHPSSSQGGVTSVEYVSGILNTSKDWDNDAMDNCSTEKEGKSTNKTSCRQDNSVSILDKFFGNALSNSSGNSPSYIESQQLNTDILVSSVPESSKYVQWFPDEGSGHAEDLSSKSLLSMIVKDENLFAENMVRGPSASDDTFENKSPRSPSYCDAGSKLLHFISPTPAVGILKEYSTSTDDITESVPVMTCEDLEQTMLAHVADTSSSNQQNTVQEHRAEQIAVDQHASHHLLSLLQKGTNRKGSSPLEFHMGPADELLSSDPNCMVNGGKTATTPVNNAEPIPTSVKNVTLEALFGAAFMNDLHSRDSPVSVREHTADGPNSSSKRLLFSEEGKTIPSFIAEDHHLGEQMVPFSHSKGGAFRMKPGTGEEYGNPEFPGSSREGASFDEKALEIQLPEEDNLFSVNDSLHAQNIDHFPFAKSARDEGLLPEKEDTDLNYRLRNLAPGEAEHKQILGHDLLGSHSHDWRDQIDLNNLYHLFQSKPSAQSPMNRASPMFPPTDHTNKNQQAPLNMPEAIHRGTRCSFRQDMNYMQHVVPAPGGPRVDPAARHLMLQHMSMPGSFPPQGLPRGVPQSQPVHHMPGYRTEMSNANSFQMHPHQPGYGEFGMAMAGPPGPEVGVNQLERLIQMELRSRSKQIHPAMAGTVPGFYEPELNMNFRC